MLAGFPGHWVEYGVVEHAYAKSRPGDWRRLIDTYGHTAIKPSHYTASAFLGATLGHLARNGFVAYHDGPATGRWRYNGRISWLAIDPDTPWDSRLSWEDSGLSVAYVPGQVEV